MEVKLDNKVNTVKFEDLSRGDLFTELHDITHHPDDIAVYQKTEEVYMDGSTFNYVNLKTGDLYGAKYDDKYVPLQASMKVRVMETNEECWG